jgi:hypothetical protein
VKKTKIKWILGGLCLSAVLAIVLFYVWREPILTKAGEFMAPRGEYTADIAILGGTTFLDRTIADAGFELLKTGKVKRLVVVLHRIHPLHRPYGMNENYPEMVRKEILKRGISEKYFEIMVTHIHEPITLTEAQGALKLIAREKVKTAILLAPGFHTRRSYLVYQCVGNSYNLKIYPQACFNGYKPEKWWVQEGAVRDFSAEAVKLAYYVLWGHIPFRFGYTNNEQNN